MGPDGILNILLKILSLSLFGPLSYLFERYFSLVFTPFVWKTAKIVPILKKCSALKVSNYRLISLTSIFKVIERIISGQLLFYLNTHKLIFILISTVLKKELHSYSVIELSKRLG